MFAMLSTILLLSATPPANDVAADKPEVQLVLGSGVEDREVAAYEEGHTPAAGDTVYAWTLVKGFPGSSVEQVWSRDGVEVARHTLSIGSVRRWRSWSHQRVRPGSYEVRVLGTDGSELAKQAFTVAAPAPAAAADGPDTH
jgi:hypothetical protein